MASATFALSAFGDEIADDLREQLQALQQLQIGYLELRGVWGKNVLHLEDDEVAQVKRVCAEYGIAVSCIGSPVGKSPITAPIEQEMSNLARIFQIAEALGTHRVRVFSFYPPDTQNNVCYDEYIEEATSRLVQLMKMAQREGFYLLLENEKEIVGDTPERCHAILSAIHSPYLQFAWDPANFVQVGVAQPTEHGWPLLGPYVAHVHVKDAVLADGSVRAAGEGDGQVGMLLTRLRDSGYQGFLALEPHLAIASRSGGFSGVGGMTRAVAALRQLMAELGCAEANP
ncbi:MAG TPA: sugar phosphate isomerase/epimerase [Anaerolineae bacterium]|nr:sugar phosphate isomerase/epimerase [Anaerolineae bacterium]HIQ04722.1 sugar phosphate isomerase/epimerase [Anaerolineae bacterium]